MLNDLFKFVDNVTSETSKVVNDIVNESSKVVNNIANESSKVVNDIANETAKAVKVVVDETSKITTNTVDGAVCIANNTITGISNFISVPGKVVNLVFEIHSWNNQERLEKKQDEERRQSLSIQFPEFLNQEEFNRIIHEEANQIIRIKKIEINQALINFEVYSISRISTWFFTLDYNDYGSLTGKVRISRDNTDSSIPKNISLRISERLNAILKNQYILSPDDYDILLTKEPTDVKEIFENFGFHNVTLLEERYEKLPHFIKNYKIHSITIGNCKYFDKDSYFDSNSSVVISYYLQENQ
ncbi:hypothetical protein D8855_03460 [Streptococcus mitis]|jgi:hypothetical protein|uniref:Uncharacterized protein n=1 Tax=Streptococcus mitis TaxID=28037 RepID=A0A3R9I947_STRMT|nr:hypothetical protein [Streptococcus mitis]RSI83991.1 hypothetical protein D8855_03460 [Streptococcus mitis]